MLGTGNSKANAVEQGLPGISKEMVKVVWQERENEL